MRLAVVLVLWGAGVVPSRGGLGDATVEFERGNRLYDEGKHAEAVAAWEGLGAAGHHSSNLYYNLGNGYYRLGENGRAVLNYVRALALEPAHPEARANLALARERAGSAVGARTWATELVISIGQPALDYGIAFGFWATMAGVVVTLLHRARVRSALVWTVVWGCGFVFATWLLAAGGDGLRDARLAIVTVREAPARFEPADGAREVLQLRAGSEIVVRAERGSWVYARLPGGSLGWVRADQVERVRP